jgi:hypothetical protein
MLDFILFLLVFVVLIRVIAIVAMMWKVNGAYILPYIILLFVLILMASCNKQDDPLFYPCKDGSCDSVFYVDSPGSYQDNNGYWHVEYWGT